MTTRRWALGLAVWVGLVGEALAGPPIADPDERSTATPGGEAVAPRLAADGEAAPTGRPSLVMSRAVLCVAVTGYEDYEERPEPRLTADEKLVIYFRPRHYAVERVKGEYRAHLSQDARIRRKGSRNPLMVKEKILDLDAHNREPIPNLYMSNTISVNDLRPGDYELDVTLHDVVGGGAPARQVVPFTIVPESGPEAR